MSTVDLVSSLSRDECVRRLRADVSSYLDIVSGKPVFGSVTSDTIKLRKRIYYRNSFQPTLRGHLDDAGGGTRIHCEFGEMPLLPVFIAAALIFVIALIVVGMTARNMNLHEVPLIAIILPLAALPLFLGIGIGSIYIGRWLARDERAFLVDFVRKTTEAK
jgi:hypothetical protein